MKKLALLAFICCFAPYIVFAAKTPEIGQISQKKGADKVLIALETCESGRNTKIKVMDAGSYSYGGLQFKKSTLEHYAVKYGFRSMLMEEDLYNHDLHRRVARRMLQEPNGWRHWFNCFQQIL